MKYKSIVPAVLLMLITGLASTSAATFTVTSTADSGPGTLRQAIEDANADAAPDLIEFNIPGGGVQTIAPLTALPAIRQPLTLDGYTQPGAAANTLAVGGNAVLRIELSGVNAPGATGLMLTTGADQSTVRGLVIHHFGTGIDVNSSDNVIAGNLIGTDATGTLGLGNEYDGIFIQGGANNLIGGLAPQARNVIAANRYGIYLYGASTVSNRVQGNFIGTDLTGASAIGNVAGVTLFGAPGTTIGGNTAASRNVISGNTGSGFYILEATATNTVVQGNYIGTDVTGTAAVPNAQGLYINSSGNLIGGTGPDAGNVISGNTGIGVTIDGAGATNNAILGNRIFGNSALGIDLTGNGVTPNDVDDADGGPNQNQNFPEITSAALAGGDLIVRYRVDSTPANAAYPLTIEFFLADSAASGEGRALLHRHTYDTPQALTNTTFTPAAAVNGGDPLVATATDANGNTSEFSAVATVTANRPPVVANGIPNQAGLYGSAFTYSFPADTFSDPDAADTLSYTAGGLPPGVTFDGPTRAFSGTPTSSGTFAIRVTATDDGLPSNQTATGFDLVVARAALVVTADDKRREPGQPNPPLTGALTGVTNSDNITATFETTASAGSPSGDYPITPVLSDPDNRLAHYTVVMNAGTLSIRPPVLVVTSPSDSGPGTLRQAIVEAGAGGTIEFAITGVITLVDPLDLAGELSIVGPGATNLTIRGNGGTRLFNVHAGSAVISGLTLSNGVDWFEAPSGGGAIRNSAHLTLNDCSIVANGSTLSGGAVMNIGAPAVFIANRCTFLRNNMTAFSGDGGGAIWNSGALRLTNCTVAGNHSLDAGAIFNRGDAILASCTVAGNSASGLGGVGGGILNNGGTLTIRNSIVAGNKADEFAAGGQDISGVIAGGDYNLIQSTNNLAVPGTHNILGVDPQISPARNLGGPTFTCGLAITSPALDAADSATSPGTDQRGAARPQGAGADIGAFEGSLPLNHAPVVANPIPDLHVAFGDEINFSIPANTFANSDEGQALTVSAIITNETACCFNLPLTLPIGGQAFFRGRVTVIVTAVDDGAPQLSASTVFDIVVPLLPLTVTADNKVRRQGDPNPPLTGTLIGVEPGDNITATFETSATAASPPGTYPITPVLNDPDGKLPQYTVVTNVGTLTVADCSLLRINNATLPSAARGGAYSVVFTAISGTPPYTFAVTGGTLPNDLTLSSSGALSGVAAAAGTFAFGVTATDALGCTVSSNYVITVESPVYEGFAYTENSALNGQNGGTGFSTPWSGATSFRVTPSLFSPPLPASGGSLNAGDGTITRRLQVPLGSPGTTRYLSVFIPVVQGPIPNDRFGILLNGTTGTGLFVGKPAAGVSAWAVENEAGGSRVTGPSIGFGGRIVVKCEFFAGNDRFTLYVNPTPGQPEPATGTAKFNSDAGTVTNIAFTAANTAGQVWFDELRISPTFAAAVPVCSSITVNPSSLPNGAAGLSYSQALNASGGTAPYAFAVTSGALPNGLLLSSAGLLSGTPVSGGSFSFIVTATDAGGCTGSRSYAMTIRTATPTPTTLINPARLDGGSFRFSFTNTPGATFTVLAAPDLSLSLSNWTVLGPVTEISPGQFQFTDPQATSLRQRFYGVRSP